MKNFFEQAKALEQEIIVRRRDFHKYPETAWTEFRTASIIAAELDKMGYEVIVGENTAVSDDMMGTPAPELVAACKERALQEGAVKKWLDKMDSGKTGVLAVMRFKTPGKTVALRVDMDANDVQEALEADHIPYLEGFASIHPNIMHACGHDAHAAIGLAVARLVANNKDSFAGTVKFVFQAAEEGGRGAKSMANTGFVDDVDYFFGAHIGLNAKKDGTVICLSKDFQVTDKFDAIFKGYASHAGAAPQEGRNALLAAAQAAMSLHAISRHADGSTRINVGILQAGSGRNVLPDFAVMKYETRGATNAINAFVIEESKRMIKGSALSFNVDVDILHVGSSPSAIIDYELGQEVYQVLNNLNEFDNVIPEMSFGAGEDCAFFINRVCEHGGHAIFLTVGVDYKYGHHNRKFDFSEKSLYKAVGAVTTLLHKFSTKN